LKANLNIPGCSAYVTDEKPGTPKHPKLVVDGVAFDCMDLVKLPGHAGTSIAAQIAFSHSKQLEDEAKALIDRFIAPML
jgi:hypothetical protein